MVGKGPSNSSVKVERYKSAECGPEYCLKKMGAPQGDWFFRWLEFFHPGIPGTARPNHEYLRQFRKIEKERQRYQHIWELLKPMTSEVAAA